MAGTVSPPSIAGLDPAIVVFIAKRLAKRMDRAPVTAKVWRSAEADTDGAPLWFAAAVAETTDADANFLGTSGVGIQG